VTRVRPLERSDVGAVASLYERMLRSGSTVPPPGLAISFARQQLDQPWYDDGVRSLVCEDDDGRLAGFLAVYARRVLIDGRPALAACSGPLLADPSVNVVAPGLLLTRAYLAGPQELSVTDGANEVMSRMWVRLGGVVAQLPSLGWTRVLEPFSFGAATAADREWRDIRGARTARALDRIARRVGRRWLAVPPTSAWSEPLISRSMLDALGPATAGFRIHPDYDEGYLRWLLAELVTVERRGVLTARLVRGEGKQVIGWYIAYVPRGGVAQVLQIVAQAADTGAVLDELFVQASVVGAAAVSGRLEPHLVDAVLDRRCIIRRTSRVLVHAKSPDVTRAVLAGEAFLTRLDGEWWMAPHLDPFDHVPQGPTTLRVAGDI
jgi:hypothetical protein